MDLNGDGVQELFVLTGEGKLYAWQDGAPQSKGLGAYAGGSLNWYLFRDTVTGGMGIEYNAEGGGYSDHWYVYLSHTTELGKYGLENANPYVNEAEVSWAEYDAEVARRVRVECTVDSVEETIEALNAML